MELREHREICALFVSKFILRREAPKDLRCNSTSTHSSRIVEPPQILRFRRSPSPLGITDGTERAQRNLCSFCFKVYPEARSAEGSPVQQHEHPFEQDRRATPD